jgi:hypothetical protein
VNLLFDPCADPLLIFPGLTHFPAYTPHMTPRSSELLRQALTLTEEERAELTGSLLESLESSFDPDAESLWEAEIVRRISSLDFGNSKTIPW